MNIQPTKDNLLIEIHRETNTAGIVFADKEQNRMERATVLETGPEVMRIEAGTTVFFKGYAVDTFTINDIEYNIIPESEIKAYESHTQLPDSE